MWSLMKFGKMGLANRKSQVDKIAKYGNINKKSLTICQGALGKRVIMHLTKWYSIYGYYSVLFN
jgi:hypothetical protein